MKQILLLTSIFLFLFQVTYGQVTSELEQNSKLTFIIHQDLTTSYNALFTKYTGVISSLSKSDYKHAKLNINIETNSIQTNNQNEKELKSSNYLDVMNYPNITLVADSANLYKSDLNEFELNGVITIRNISKKITLKAYLLEGPLINKDAKFIKIKLLGAVKASDFGMKENKAFYEEKTGNVLGEKAVIDFLLIFKVN